MYDLLAPFLSDSQALFVLHKPGFRGCQGENTVEIGDERIYWNKKEGGGSSSLLMCSGPQLRCKEKENKEAKDEQEEKPSSLIQQQQNRKLMASLSSMRFLLETMLGTRLSSFLLCRVARRDLYCLFCWPGKRTRQGTVQLVSSVSSLHRA